MNRYINYSHEATIMVAFDGLEDIFKSISEYSEYSRAVLTVITATGFLTLIWLTLASLYHTIQGKSLYKSYEVSPNKINSCNI